MNNCIAIITARGGSKRIPRKNIKEFMGKPMLAYAIEAALGAKIFDEIMVSTDDEEIKEIALKCGAKVPFMRSEATSNDFAGTSDVISEVIEEYSKLNQNFEDICCIYPCVPFLTSDILKNAYDTFKNSSGYGLMPVVKYSSPIQRAVVKDSNNFAQYREPKYSEWRTQDLEPAYHDVGMFYYAKTEKFIEEKNIITSKTVLFEMDELVVQDIDTPEDWKLAELKYSIIKNKG